VAYFLDHPVEYFCSGGDRNVNKATVALSGDGFVVINVDEQTVRGDIQQTRAETVGADRKWMMLRGVTWEVDRLLRQRGRVDVSTVVVCRIASGAPTRHSSNRVNS